MTTGIILLAVGLVVPCFFLWAAIHEVSHYLAARWLLGAQLYSMKLYPNTDLGRFCWAYVTYEYPDQKVPGWKQFFISTAPRFPGLLATIAFVATPLFFNPWLALIWFMITGAGIIDYIVGLIGKHPKSDLQRAADAAGVNPWLLRAIEAGPLAWVGITIEVLIRIHL